MVGEVFMRHGKIVALCLAMVVGVCSCSTYDQNSIQKEDRAYKEQYEKACTTPFGKYPETVTYTLGKMTGTNNSNMPEGDTYENNAYTRYLKEMLNVQNHNVFEVAGTDGYDDVVDMAIVNKNIPDIMVVSDLKTVDKLVKLDMIEDLTQAYEQCVSERIKTIYNSYSSGLMNNVTYDGKLMALPGTSIDDGPNLLWLRKDCMDQLGLKEPESIEDVVSIIRAFIKNNPGKNGETVGLVCDTNLSGDGGYSLEYRADILFASFDAYPKQWIYDDDGNVVYGSVQKEAKQALAKLHELYEENVLDNKFLLRTTTNIIELIEEGKCGSFFGPWWTPNNPLMQAMAKDSSAQWQPYIIPTKGKDIVSYATQNPGYKYVVVRKGYEHPEVAAKIISTLFDYGRYEDKSATELEECYKQNIDPSARPIAINIDYSDALQRCYSNLSAVLDGKKEITELEMLENSYYESCKTYLDALEKGERPSLESWAAYTSRITACSLLQTKTINKVESLFFGTTKTMKSEWWQLETLEKKAYLEIVTGERPIDYFDEFVKEWYREGGRKISKEVAEIVKQQYKK